MNTTILTPEQIEEVKKKDAEIKKRQQWRKEAAAEYQEADVENVFSTIDADDFHSRLDQEMKG